MLVAPASLASSYSADQPVEPFDGCMQQLAVGRESDGLGCTVVSTVTRLRSRLRSAPASCATLRLSASRSSSLSPKRLRRILRSHRLLRYGHRIRLCDSTETQTANCRLPMLKPIKACNPKRANVRKTDS